MVKTSVITKSQTEALEHLHAPTTLLDLAAAGNLFVRKASAFSASKEQYVARFCDVAHLIKDGDGAWFGGVMPWSLAIRLGTVSVVSHGGLLFNQTNHIQLIDVCEGKGCRNRRFSEEVHKNHGQHFWCGQWYWGAMANTYRRSLNIAAVEKFAGATIGSPYGHLAIIYVAMFQLPIFREFAFLRWHKSIESNWENTTPYCSMFQSLAMQHGGLDPVPGRALQLTTPQDTWQSLLWPIKIALVK